VTPTTAEWGLGGGYHVCLVHDSQVERLRALEREVAVAFEAGERVLVVAESPDDQTTSDLLGRTGRGAREGQVIVAAPEVAYLPSGGIDHDRAIATLESAKASALADGFTGMRLLADMSWAADGLSAGDLADYERDAGVVFADGRASAVCQYDRARFGASAIATCAAAHPLLRSAFDETETIEDHTVSIHVGRHGTVRAAGEVDMANADTLARALRMARERSPDVCLDASDLTFIDVRGVSAVFDAAREGTVALLAPSSPLRGMLKALGANGNVPGLQLG
jgi:hypothetical protein